MAQQTADSQSSIFLTSIQIHPSWDAFFQQAHIQQELTNIQNIIGQSFTPAPERVLRFATVNLADVKVIILGKDPYPQEGVATGRSFEVNGVSNWFDKKVNSSLKNIIKLMHKTYMKRDVAASIAEVRADIQSGTFPVLPPDQAFDNWEKKGGLFLNTAYTCQIGGIEASGSHLQIWRQFFEALLQYITKSNAGIRYFLWGDARKYEKKLVRNGVAPEHIYLSLHPSTNGDTGGYENNTRFLNCPCFLETEDMIEWVTR
ncbi:uracil-DNA glycosylase [Aneurinibacillus aneurinilyticus]|jgi:uracil-DNA glycosylase|uniref:uracil-DNA glycosylase n=1 Tax=Aneurinibacillus aneurinilyticus TaxID=1391 RepID=UPI0023F260E5|nr:uracil-DNA glycosylase [Aneurinibacillus aneurinilyticus]MCI1696339.1 uracil-DNA glycosylase [Aneurinibacillus aneurinilyticus]